RPSAPERMRADRVHERRPPRQARPHIVHAASPDLFQERRNHRLGKGTGFHDSPRARPSGAPLAEALTERFKTLWIAATTASARASPADGLNAPSGSARTPSASAAPARSSHPP